MELAFIKYIQEKIPTLDGRFYPIFTTDISELSVVYNFTPVSGGHVKQSMVEFRVIHQDYDTCKQMEQALNNLLDMEEDMPFISKNGMRFHTQLSGGGVLYNEAIQRHELTIIYTIDWR